jgi:putative cell wall-binding protein
MSIRRTKKWQGNGLHSVISLVAAAALTLSVAPAQADPDHGLDEDGPVSQQRLTIAQEDLLTLPDPEEPGAMEGVVPDLADLPDAWLEPTPAGPATLTPEQPAGSGVDQAVPAPPSKPLPATVDAAPGWQPTYSCDPNDKPGIVAFAELVAEHYDRPRYSTSRRCLAGSTSQHGEGRAVDWSMNAYDAEDKAIGDAVAAWLTVDNGAMARRFGIMSIIWNRQSWYLYDPGSWRTYTGASPHTDHLHISFTWDGAMQRTSWWTGTPVTQVDHGTCRVYALQYAPRYTDRRTTPCPTSLPAPPPSDYPVVLPGARSDTVATAQAYLGLRGLAVDGSFGPTTLATLMEHQRAEKLPVTGVLDNATWHDVTTGVSRVYGSDRYGTAHGLSLFTATGGDVYVTTGDTYPDALAASAQAGADGAPVLLVRSTGVPAETVTALQRAKPSRIVVVGGATRIPTTVLDALKPFAGAGGVTRVAGEDRYATAGELARSGGSPVPVAYVATGTDYPSALVAAARAASQGAPVLLTRPTALPAATIAALQDVRPERIVVVGDTGEVSSSVASALASHATTGQVQRIAGSSPADTAATLAVQQAGGVDAVYVATSATFPDALAAAARAGHQDAPVLLTSPTQLPSATRAALTHLQPKAVIVAGGPDAIAPAVVTALEEFAQ